MAGQYTIPMVVEQRPQGERTSDVFSRLLADRIVFIGTEIDTASQRRRGAAPAPAAESPDLPIQLYLNSPGGSITALLAIYDTMQYVPTAGGDVLPRAGRVGGRGPAGSRRTGQRHVLEHSRVLLHQPSGGAQGTAADLQIQAHEILRLRAQVDEVLARHVGRPVEELRAATERT